MILTFQATVKRVQLEPYQLEMNLIFTISKNFSYESGALVIYDSLWPSVLMMVGPF